MKKRGLLPWRQIEMEAVSIRREALSIHQSRRLWLADQLHTTFLCHHETLALLSDENATSVDQSP